MKSVYRRYGLVFLAVWVATGFGCGKPGPKLVPVSGIIVNGDKPVAGAAVQFAADISQGSETLDAYGATNGEGRFTLKTVSHGKGAMAGRYKVIITTDGPARRLIPTGITDLHSATLVVDIPQDGTQDLKLDLSKYK